ncbi:MAG: 50S ribosomal protein L23 [Elusimicrobia bacterium]|nr:50S ribosomal protein L23 [Elusimicrobiota bacterium]MDE2312631.1 50S ribosomal protein L23 [Elusimicrobiota bacterium]
MSETKNYQTLVRPILTERSTLLKEKHNQYFFVADLDATKTGIKKAVEDLFKVKVASVRTMIVPGKTRRMGRSEGRKPDWKKAVVTLEAGQKIDFTQETV